MSKSKNFVFKALHIVAYVIFVGLCIEAGALIVNFVISIYKPEFVGNLYQKLDLSKMYTQSKSAFFGIYSFVLVIAVLKALLFYVVISLLHKLDMTQPFNNFVAHKILQISNYTFSIGLLSYIAKETAEKLSAQDYEIDALSKFWVDSQAFILMAAIVYVIAKIFKRGIELQTENDLTI